MPSLKSDKNLTHVNIITEMQGMKKTVVKVAQM